MTKTVKNFFSSNPGIASLATAVLIVAACAFSSVAITKANPTGFPPGAKTAVATSTPAVMTPGTATSTIVYDSYNISGTNQPTTGLTSAADTATLLVQFTASSTSSKLKIAYEYSQDGVDWYQDGITGGLASSTPGVIPLLAFNSFSWTFASTSLDGAALSATNNLATEILPVPTPTRFVRAVVSVTGANAMVYAQFVPKKQAN